MKTYFIALLISVIIYCMVRAMDEDQQVNQVKVVEVVTASR